MKKVKEISWVCLACAEERGARIPSAHIPTWHVGECSLCGFTVEVTEPRDFGRTRHLLESESYGCDKCGEEIIPTCMGGLKRLVDKFTVRIYCDKCGEIVKRAEHTMRLEGSGRRQ